MYLGQWLIGTNITEGRGMIFTRDGLLYEGYVKNNERTGYGRTILRSLVFGKNVEVYQGEHKDGNF